MNRSQFQTSQRGSFMLEALIGILIFSLGVLAIIALQANAIAVQTDAQYRIEAANFSDQILGQINLNVARDAATSTVNTTDLLTFNHQPTGTVPTCSFSGVASTNPLVTSWATAVNSTAGTRLPGGSAATQQIVVDTANANRVTVILCWKNPKDAAFRFHRVIAYIN